MDTPIEDDSSVQLITIAELTKNKQDNVWNIYHTTTIPLGFNINNYDVRHTVTVLEQKASNDVNISYEGYNVSTYDELYDTSMFDDCREELASKNAQISSRESIEGSTCIKCGENAVTTVLKQLRSADEGATEITTCMRCGYKQM